jgi:hypothetical protein
LGKLLNGWGRGGNRLFWETEGIFEGEMSFKPNKIRVIEFGYINSLKLIVEDDNKMKINSPTP